MSTGSGSKALAQEARNGYVRWVQKALVPMAQALEERLRQWVSEPCPPDQTMLRRDAWESYQRLKNRWTARFSDLVGQVSASRPGAGKGELSLVDDDTIEQELMASRLALTITERASSEFTDLRSRINALDAGAELATTDVLRPQHVARCAMEGWMAAGLSLAAWKTMQRLLQDEIGAMVAEAYHELNRALLQRGVMPSVDLRPFIRRTGAPSTPPVPSVAPVKQPASASADPSSSRVYIGSGETAAGSSGRGHPASGWGAGVGEETRLMTRTPGLRRTIEEAHAVIGRLNQLVGQYVPGFEATAPMGVVSPRLGQAIGRVARQVQDHFPTTQAMAGMIGTPQIIAEFNQRKQALKEAAETPGERAVIEIVALMFQSILVEERIPATIRVWFARLQMPVLRVAVAEPDFFSGTDHPARRLIDRMGGCVLGFDRSASIGEALEKEIKRVVQVVEAYPDTGRRVFQTVLNEFEKFLSRYFAEENEASRKGVSLAQQVEQKEIYTVQFTIELRKMLDEVPVQEVVREFLFQVWADVLAITATKEGLHADQTRSMKRAAAELIWSASAKVTREERAEVIRKLPGLLRILRDGMTTAGLNGQQQDGHIRELNGALQAAFTAKTAAISNERMEELTMRLESLEDLLPDGALEVSEDLILDISGYESQGLEVVSEGGSMPNASMLAWAKELQVGGWFRLDYRGRLETVQLAWQGLRKQLSLFVSPAGRCVLFQHKRLAAFLQAGLILPAEDETLTVRATRDALAKLDADPTRLLN